MQEHQNGSTDRKRRLLVVDDNEGIHEDFRKILTIPESPLDNMEALLFGNEMSKDHRIHFEIDSAFQGRAGLDMVRRSLVEGVPYDFAIVDLRMPPGWDGLETIAKIWEADPQLPIVLCAAFLGQSQDEIIAQLGRSEGITFMQKPFEPSEFLALAHSISERKPSPLPSPIG